MKRAALPIALFFPCLVLACGANAVNVTAPPAAAMAAPRTHRDGPHVVLLSIDALKPEYFLDPSRAAKIPNLRALMANGIYGALESVMPTVTYPSHTTMVTGVNPSRHGVLANTPLDPFNTNQGGWNWYAEMITAPTLWQGAHAHHLTVGSVYWPVTVGADIDWNIPQIWRAKNEEDDKLERALSSPPGLTGAIERQGKALPNEMRDDTAKADAADFIIRKYQPDLMLVYYSDLDTIQHKTGPFSVEAYATLEALDTQVGRLVTAVREAGLGAQTTFLVVSDHGFANVDHVIRPAVGLAKSGLIDVDANGHVRDWQASVLGAGGTCGIYVKDPHDPAMVERVHSALDLLAGDPDNGIERVWGADDIARWEGFKGASFVLSARPGFYFSGALTGDVVSASGDKGMHGYPPDHLDMHASIIAAGPAVSARGNVGLLHTIDLAPTIAGILGFEMPSAEGHRIPGLSAKSFYFDASAK